MHLAIKVWMRVGDWRQQEKNRKSVTRTLTRISFFIKNVTFKAKCVKILSQVSEYFLIKNRPENQAVS